MELQPLHATGHLKKKKEITVLITILQNHKWVKFRVLTYKKPTNHKSHTLQPRQEFIYVWNTHTQPGSTSTDSSTNQTIIITEKWISDGESLSDKTVKDLCGNQHFADLFYKWNEIYITSDMHLISYAVLQLAD